MLEKLTPRRAVLMIIPLMALLIIVFVSIAACSPEDEVTMPPVASGTVVITPSSSVPNDEASIRGFITRITNSADSTEILVEYFCGKDEEPEYLYDKVLIKLDENTAFVSDNGTIINASSLTVGSTVEAWFSEPGSESYPVLAYGQAVRLITPGDAMNGMRGLPRCTVTGTSKSLAGVVSALWVPRGYNYSTTISDVLDTMRGAHITSAAGNTLSFSFSIEPEEFEVTWSRVKFEYIDGESLEVGENNEIVVPAEETGELFMRVNARWASGTIVYGFSVSIVEQK